MYISQLSMGGQLADVDFFTCLAWKKGQYIIIKFKQTQNQTNFIRLLNPIKQVAITSRSGRGGSRGCSEVVAKGW